jgi:hypothetical protein
MCRSAALVVLSVQLVACLPEGGPGIGRQVVAERGLADVSFTRERANEAGAFLLFTRATAATSPGDSTDALLRDLFVISRDGGEARLRAERLPSQVRSSYFWDVRGRLYLHRNVTRQPAAQPGLPALVSWELLSLDPLADDTVSLGGVRGERLSPARARLFCQRTDGASSVRDLTDGSERPVATMVRQSLFIGEDLYFVDDSHLGRLVAGADAPENLLPAVLAVRPIATPEGDLVVRRPTADSKDEAVAVVRLTPDGPLVTDLGRASLIGDPFVSPDGGRVAWVSARPAAPEIVDLNVRDLVKGTSHRSPVTAPAVIMPPATSTRPPAAPQVDVSFRPGGEEVWFSIDVKLFVQHADAVLSVDRAVNTVIRIGPERSADRLADDQPTFSRRARASLFTSDGRRWIFQGADARHHLGNADDPGTDGGIAVSTIGGASDLLELEPGRRLAVWLSPGNDRVDLYLLDPENDQLRFLVSDVGSTLFGQRRVLAIARKVGDRRATGDLVLLDLASGAETLLAHNVSEFAIPAPCAGCDPTAPGAPFAYVVQARVPWRYEGLWTGELP